MPAMFALDCSRCYTKLKMGLGCFAKLNASVWKILCALLLPAPGRGFFLSYLEGKVCEKLCKAGTLPLNRHVRMQNKDLLFFQPSTQNFVFSLQGPPSVRNKNNVNHYPLSSSTQCHVADVEAYGWMGISAADKKHSWSRNIIYNNGNNNCFSRIFIRYISWQITKAIPKCHKVSK